MLIKPTQHVPLTLFLAEASFKGTLVELSERYIVIKCNTFFDKNDRVDFINPYFKGNGIIVHIRHECNVFIYNMLIENIQFKPGMVMSHRV